MEATAYPPDGRPTASGTVPHRGIVAADPAVLPLGSVIRVTGAGVYNGVYTVTDTGGKISGRHIDIYMRTAAEARRFGKKMVVVRVLELGAGKEEARAIDVPAHPALR
jgi:rare lipoprotein A